MARRLFGSEGVRPRGAPRHRALRRRGTGTARGSARGRLPRASEPGGLAHGGQPRRERRGPCLGRGAFRPRPQARAGRLDRAGSRRQPRGARGPRPQRQAGGDRGARRRARSRGEPAARAAHGGARFRPEGPGLGIRGAACGARGDPREDRRRARGAPPPFRGRRGAGTFRRHGAAQARARRPLRDPRPFPEAPREDAQDGAGPRPQRHGRAGAARPRRRAADGGDLREPPAQRAQRDLPPVRRGVPTPPPGRSASSSSRRSRRTPTSRSSSRTTGCRSRRPTRRRSSSPRSTPATPRRAGSASPRPPRS